MACTYNFPSYVSCACTYKHMNPICCAYKFNDALHKVSGATHVDPGKQHASDIHCASDSNLPFTSSGNMHFLCKQSPQRPAGWSSAPVLSPRPEISSIGVRGES